MATLNNSYNGFALKAAQELFRGDVVAEYHLLTIWRIDAPLPQVYDAIYDSMHWPDWWPGAEKVEQIADGNGDGIDNIRRYSWRGKLPYPVVFEIRATSINKLVAIEGLAEGDLEGIGRWRFSRKGKISVVRYEWHVRSTKRWMNLLAPLARSIFINNHARVMAQGGEGLARLLGSSLVSQKNIDLMAKEVQVRPKAVAARQHWRQGGRINPLMLLISGTLAGTIATIAQITLWWWAGMPILETLLRDARLTAALIMGIGVLPPPATAQWDILLVATFIHFGLSVIYAVIPAVLARYLNGVPALAAGALYGLAIYTVNLYGFTTFFPWFAISRDWVTMATHVIFGISLVGCWLAYCRQTLPRAGRKISGPRQSP